MAELSQHYYFENFQLFIQHIKNLQWSFLKESEKQFIQSFEDLPPQAQLLITRLLMRTKKLIRGSKIQYQEIQLIKEQIEILLKNEMLKDVCQENFETEVLLNELAKKELIKLFPKSTSEKKKKNEMIIDILKIPQNLLKDTLSQFDQYYELPCRPSFDILQILFFGNIHQGLHEFILQDLGLLTYEKYQINTNSSFVSQEELYQVIHLYQFEEMMNPILEETTLPETSDIFYQPLYIKTAGPTALRKKEKLLNMIARQKERENKLSQAIFFYEKSNRPPSRERQTRIYLKTKQNEKTLALLQQMKAEHKNLQEASFAQKQWDKIHHIKNQQRILCQKNAIAPYSANQSTEQNAIHFLAEEGWEYYHLENKLMGGLFGLWFWQEIFMPCPGAFFNPFQRGPTDLFSHDFYQNRKDSLESRLEQLMTCNELLSTILQIYHEKEKIANFLVDWNAIQPDTLKKAITYIPRNHIKIIFQRMMKNLGQLKSGFPDLIGFSEKQNYQWVEVKGPGDTLQENQKEWLYYFEENQIPYHVLYLQWK